MMEEPSNLDQGVSKLEFINLKEIVLKLKAVKEKDHLSISDIMERLEESGSSLAESTVRRVFRDNSENDLGFTYAKVLKPIADVMLDEELETANDPALFEKNEALHAIVREKNREIEALQEKIETLENRIEEIRQQHEDSRTVFENRIDRLWDQIHLKDKRMDEKDVIIRDLNAERVKIAHKLVEYMEKCMEQQKGASS